MVKSKYSLSTMIVLGLSILLPLFLIFLSTTLDLTANAKKVPVPNYLLLFLFFLIASYFIFRAFKSAPFFTISSESIIISGPFRKKRDINSTDIAEIDLFAPGYLDGSVTIVTKIGLKNGEKIKLSDSKYANTHTLKQYLVEHFNTKIKSYSGIKRESFDIVDKDKRVEKFIGNPVLNFNTFLFSGFIAFMVGLAILIPTPHKNSWLVFLIVTPELYLLFAYQSHYFIITDKYLTVKNYLFPLLRKKYLIDEIIVANFETPGRLSQSLRITTIDFKSRYYSAGSLKNKDWDLLREKIENLEIFFIR